MILKLPHEIKKTALLFFALLFGFVFSPVRADGVHVFIELGNLADVLRQVAETGILAVGMTFVVLTGGIDLGVGAVMALTATFCAKAMMGWGWSLPPTVAAGLGVGAGIGFFYAVLISKLRLPAFVVTLAGLGIFRGVARLLADGGSISITAQTATEPGAPASFFIFAEKLVQIISVPALLFIGVFIGAALFLRYTVMGRQIYAYGGNPIAAKWSKISELKTLAVAYIFCSGLAALTGILHAAQMEQGNPNDGVGYELDAIAAVVIGGTNLSGGRGTIVGTVVGTLVIGILNNILGLNNVDINLQLIAKGLIILAALSLPNLFRRKRLD